MELSTGAPKSENKLVNTAYLRVKNNKVSDLITVQTKDFVDVSIRVSYSVDFLPEFKDNWFSVENYVKFLCDKQRSLLKQKAKQYNIEDFYANVTEIVRKTALNLPDEDEERGESKYEGGRLFRENGMFVHDVEVLGIGVEAGIARILERQRTEMVTKALELSDAEKKMEVVTQLAEYEKREIELTHKNNLYKMELEQTLAKTKLDAEAEINKKKRVEAEAKKQAEADMQKLLDQIQAAELARDKKHDEAKIETEKELAAIEKAKQEAYAATVAKIMESVSPQLVAAMTAKANADTLSAVSQGMAPYAIANGESIADTVNKLLRGTTLESVLENLNEYKIAE